MISVNWQNLRSWNNSQHAAFEILCCQLAAHEQVPHGSRFTRKGTPDGGIEGFWRLPNGDEWGWQAKFFTSPPGKSQWHQLDDSVKTAITKHPRLTLYTICLPIDRPSPNIKDQKSFMSKWQEHVKKWQAWAHKKNMVVEFNYWGEHEILDRLSREEHRGRYQYWFNREFLSQKWFKKVIEEAVANVGPRYTPELNVNLPIYGLFEGLGRTSEFYTKIKVLHGKTKQAYSRAQSLKDKEFAKNEFSSLRQLIDQLLPTLETIAEPNMDYIEFGIMERLASESRKMIWQCTQNIERTIKEETREVIPPTDQKSKPPEEKSSRNSEDLSYKRHLLFDLSRVLGELTDFTQDHEARLANVPALLLTGEAGTGKTHLFCDIARQRTTSELPTVLLLGVHFSNDEPWSQILRLLGLNCTKEEFLGALEAAAEARGSRALIFIDALNEGAGKMLWHDHLAGMLTTLSHYQWIGLAVSVRTSYESLVIPNGLVPNRLIRETHRGFAEQEYQASQAFFHYFDIQYPSVPLLIPEFQNPLFLKLFCLGLRNRGLKRVPPGLQGITSVFNFFVESVNEKLSKAEYLDFDPKSQIVNTAIEKLARIMADKGNTWLPRQEAQDIVNCCLPRNGYANSLFRHMISEGILVEDRFLIDKDGEWNEGIHFSYERFSDHLIAKYLLDMNLDPDDPSKSFQPNKTLGLLSKDAITCWQNRGLIDAFSIQIPERINKELPEITPRCANFQSVMHAFIESLVWRDPKTISSGTLLYINKHIVKYKDTHDRLLEAFLTVASNPAHPYNADFLHSHLIKLELADRDAWWSTFLHYQYGAHGAVDRLIDWAWNAGDKSCIDDESIRLCGVALAWFLTTSNRFLRDRATKALVSLLTDRIPVLRSIVRGFLKVNDPYVLERLFAVAYGCAMRTRDNEALAKLARDVFVWIFEKGSPPPHILLRDYARGTIEVAVHRRLKLDIDLKKIRPPYKSEWSSRIPTEEDLKKYREWHEGMPDEEWARVSLYESVMGFGDFARYIIGTNSGFFEWSSRRLGEPKKPSRKEIYENFIQSLSGKQKKAWKQYLTIRTNVRFYGLLDKSKRVDLFKRELTDDELKHCITVSQQFLEGLLGKKKLQVFHKSIIPYLNNPNPYRDEYQFDLSIAQRWIFNKVMDLGWTVERFGEFDRYVDLYCNRGREASKAERIGKKYQWIAYHEFLARVSDNFEFRDKIWTDQTRSYEGPWQLYGRDIDPSCLLRNTWRESWEPMTINWWSPLSYDGWETEKDDVKWLKNAKDLPQVKDLIKVANPKDGSNWLVLEGYYRWEQPTPAGEEQPVYPRNEIWYLLKSYIIKKSDMNKVYQWAKKQNFMGRWMPESHEIIGVFLGEFFWAPVFNSHSVPDYDRSNWTRGDRNLIPKKVLVSTDQYLRGHSGFDCSIDDSIHIYLPTKWLVDRMGLCWNGIEGHFYDHGGSLVAFDPSVRETGPGCLLVNCDAFLKFLDEKGYDVLWTVLGEKRILSGLTLQEEWKGLLEISGAFRIHRRKVEGNLNANFRSRN